MTEASENAYLVRVRAQVMCRDEGTGGWVALGGGGLADVMVGKRRHVTPSGGDSNGDSTSSSAAPAPAHEYYIHGKRISDNMVVLECTIKKDFQYNKVMPTFHHWVTDEKRFGLTFQTAADARAFDKGVRTAVEELLDAKASDGLRRQRHQNSACKRQVKTKTTFDCQNPSVFIMDISSYCFAQGLGGAWPSLHAYKQHNPAPKDDDEEHNIFECLNLPCSSRSSSENSSGGRARDTRDQTPILCAIALPDHRPESGKKFDARYDEKLGVVDTVQERCPYVHLSAMHDYTYASVIGSGEKTSPNTRPPLLKRDSGSFKKCSYGGPPPLPGKKPTGTFQARIKCRHCHEWYLESANRAGACEFAPDCFRSCINTISCIKCAQCMVYHCMSDTEGEFTNRPCACAPPSDACAKRWIGVGLLSLLVPCLCCYAPLRCAHRAATRHELVGGHHAPIH